MVNGTDVELLMRLGKFSAWNWRERGLIKLYSNFKKKGALYRLVKSIIQNVTNIDNCTSDPQMLCC